MHLGVAIEAPRQLHPAGVVQQKGQAALRSTDLARLRGRLLAQDMCLSIAAYSQARHREPAQGIDTHRAIAQVLVQLQALLEQAMRLLVLPGPHQDDA